MPKKFKLPRKLIVIENSDKKGWGEKWYEGRDPLNVPHIRCILNGMPNVGKGVAIRNMMIRAQPAYQRLIIIHVDEKTTEYDDCSPTLITNKVPDPDSEIWGETDMKTLCIIDDVPFRSMSKSQKSNLIMLFRNVSSHRNVNIMLTCHNFFSVPIELRRSANFFVVWRSRDRRNLKAIAGRVGYSQDEFTAIIDQYLVGFHDSLWIDHTPRSEFPLRINGYEMLM